MSKLSTMVRDLVHFRPGIGQKVVVWDSYYRAWVVARFASQDCFVALVNGRKVLVSKPRWWIPLPNPPEEENS